MAAARAGKHLVLEKPLALTLKDADKVIETIN
ncbi:MAG: Gfo/Idh/MocA family oxidoreductase, partial [Candidatus Aenigmarchaeota archaeon]|nr:Gfo/Idh/MocA family oxidoreductase [Candidatus Aenigmarchaeota archaeon]